MKLERKDWENEKVEINKLIKQEEKNLIIQKVMLEAIEKEIEKYPNNEKEMIGVG